MRWLVLLNKAISVLLVFTFLFTMLSVNSVAAEPTVSAVSACLMIANTGEVIYEKNAHTQRGMASTTKIMTSLVALENCDLYRTIRAKKEDVTVEGTSIGLKAGDKINLLTLVKGMLLESGNDAANVTATLVAGDREKFTLLMNRKSKDLGMVNTSFKNPSGLTQEGHFSTAYDMAVLASFALQNEQFRKISQMKSCRVSYGTPIYQRTFKNHNRFLDMYEGAIGIKTGYTKASGRCLVTATQRNGVTLVCVTLNASDDWNDHKKLSDYGFSVIKQKTAPIDLSRLTVNVVNSSKEKIDLSLVSELKIPYFREFPEYKAEYCISPFYYAGIVKGDYMGWVEIKAENGIVIDKACLISDENAENITTQNVENNIKKENFFRKIFKVKDCR